MFDRASACAVDSSADATRRCRNSAYHFDAVASARGSRYQMGETSLKFCIL